MILTFEHTKDDQNNASPFFPTFSYNFWHTQLNKIDWFELRDWCLEKEKEIMKHPPMSDSGTGLMDHTTTREPLYNILKWGDETKWLRDAIREEHASFTKELDIPDEKLYTKAWINVMRKGDKIKTHSHNNSVYSYLSGHITVAANQTYTYYVSPYTGEHYNMANEVGKFTLFPAWVPHGTTEVIDDEPRITIAMDIWNEKSFNHFLYGVHSYDRERYIEV